MTTLRRDAASRRDPWRRRDAVRTRVARGRTVAVVGLARSGVAAARLLRRLGAHVLGSDSGAEGLAARRAALEREGVRSGPAATPTRPSRARSWWW